eukprot:1874959-Prymnesium_polylepis.1
MTAHHGSPGSTAQPPPAPCGVAPPCSASGRGLTTACRLGCVASHAIPSSCTGTPPPPPQSSCKAACSRAGWKGRSARNLGSSSSSSSSAAGTLTPPPAAPPPPSAR